MKPTHITHTWKTSVHTTAFNPPSVVYKMQTPPVTNTEDQRSSPVTTKQR